jgi:ribonucleoside-diphosphate reductase alpha chain
MQVLEASSESSHDDDASPERPGLLVPRQRPTSVAGVTDRVRTGHGNMYVNITFDGFGKPFEVFTTVGKAGGCDSANLEAVSRLVSLALRSGIDPDEILAHLEGITCCPAWDGGTLIRSAPDAVAHVLSNHIQASHAAVAGPSEEQSIGIQPGLFPSARQANGPAAGNGHGQSVTATRCPKCSGNLIPQEGCLNCLDCGYSKCE